jgi:hypothetical protein
MVTAGWCCPQCGTALVSGSRFCHRCGRSLTGTLHPRLHILQRVLLVLGWLACVVGWLLVIPTAETVIGSGPVILILALSTIIVGLILRHYRGVIAGAADCGVCVLFFILVVALRWSPRDAHQPFLIMGFLYVAVRTPLTILAWRLPPQGRPPWQCQICGYNLFGLSEPRCPECGAGFDPARLAELTPPDAAVLPPAR